VVHTLKNQSTDKQYRVELQVGGSAITTAPIKRQHVTKQNTRTAAKKAS